MASFPRGARVEIIAGPYKGTIGEWTGSTITCNTGDFNIFGTESLRQVPDGTKMREVRHGKLIWTE